jgi:hypothetical protein
VVETVVTHGRGAPLISRSPRPCPFSKIGAEFQSRKALRAVARENAGLRDHRWRQAAPARNGAGVASPAGVVELFYFGRGERSIIYADVVYGII